MTNDQWLSAPFIVVIVILIAAPMVRAWRDRRGGGPRPPTVQHFAGDNPTRRVPPIPRSVYIGKTFYALDRLYGNPNPPVTQVFVNVYEAISPPNRPVNYVSNLGHGNRRDAVDTACMEHDRRCVYRLRVKFKPPSQWPKIPVLPPGDKIELKLKLKPEYQAILDDLEAEHGRSERPRLPRPFGWAGDVVEEDR